MADAARARAIGDELVRIHRELRRDLDSALATLDDPRSSSGAAPGLGTELRDRCLAVCDTLHAHHGNEENRGFPRLAERFPELAPVLEELRREHAVVARIRGDIRDALAGPADPRRVRAELRRLSAELDAHFAYEEDRLVAALNTL